MKKLIAILTAVITILSFASCSINDENIKIDKEQSKLEKKMEKEDEKIFEQKNFHKEFSDSDGKLCVVLDITYPELKDSADFEGKDKFNSWFESYCDDVCKNIEINVENTSADMERFGYDTPLNKVYVYTLNNFTDEYISIIMSSFSKFREPTDEDERYYTGYTFSKATGERVKFVDIFGEDENAKETVIEEILTYADTNYSPNGYAISDETKEKIRNNFSADSFVISDEGVKFVFNYSELSNGSLSGIFYGQVNYK